MMHGDKIFTDILKRWFSHSDNWCQGNSKLKTIQRKWQNFQPLKKNINSSEWQGQNLILKYAFQRPKPATFPALLW